MLAAVIAVGAMWGPMVWRHVEVLRWQSTAMSYARPTEQVVYEEGATAADALVARPGYALYPNVGAVQRTGIRPVVHLPSFPDYRGYFNFPIGVLFLHGRRTPSGTERIVIVQPVVFASTAADRGVVFASDVWRPAGLTTPMEWCPDRRAILSGLDGVDCLRLYAGQPDPADPSRFMIEFDLNGRRGRVIGRLRDDESIQMEVENWPREQTMR